MFGFDFGSFLGGVGGGALNYKAAREQNKTAREIARESMEFSAKEASRQMEFQERMSNTSHQREIEDLKKAGLNPLLSATEGASTPPGAAGTGETAPVVPELSQFYSAAKDTLGFIAEMRSKKAQIDLTESHRANVDADTKLKKGNIPSAQARGDFVNWLREMMKAKQAQFSSAYNSYDKMLKSPDVRGQRMLELNVPKVDYFQDYE